MFPIFRTFLGDFNPQKLPSRRLQALWEWKNRVLLEEYYIFNVVIPLEEFEHYEYDRYETTTCYYYLLVLLSGTYGTLGDPPGP